MSNVWDADQCDELLQLLQQVRREMRQANLHCFTITRAIDLVIGYEVTETYNYE